MSRRAAQDARQGSGRRFQCNKRPQDDNVRRCHLANRDDLVIKAFADHLQNLNHSNLANQRHLSEIENLKKGQCLQPDSPGLSSPYESKSLCKYIKLTGDWWISSKSALRICPIRSLGGLTPHIRVKRKEARVDSSLLSFSSLIRRSSGWRSFGKILGHRLREAYNER